MASMVRGRLIFSTAFLRFRHEVVVDHLVSPEQDITTNKGGTN